MRNHDGALAIRPRGAECIYVAIVERFDHAGALTARVQSSHPRRRLALDAVRSALPADYRLTPTDAPPAIDGVVTVAAYAIIDAHDDTVGQAHIRRVMATLTRGHYHPRRPRSTP